MKAEYTIKIGDVFYKAGQELPADWGKPKKQVSEIKESETAVTATAEPPVSADEPAEQTRPAKRQYNRRK